MSHFNLLRAFHGDFGITIPIILRPPGPLLAKAPPSQGMVLRLSGGCMYHTMCVEPASNGTQGVTTRSHHG